ncbi:hypothetical protein SAMN04488033_12038 [Salegentibacter agarivorans]|uniref:Uncharacterized protein n=1 Tax=Salegentibacter agarivorans TaxID=345907 RepID=A0A1I2NIZ3_9FLAO|nr:hypothetical protein SAMN04488033_12038 [Salegentibacter agarivorans]
MLKKLVHDKKVAVHDIFFNPFCIFSTFDGKRKYSTKNSH